MKKVTPKLLEKYYNNQCDQAERAFVENWLNREKPVSPNEENYLIEAWEHIVEKTQGKPRGRQVYLSFFSFPVVKLGVAAFLVSCLFFGIYIYENQLEGHQAEELFFANDQIETTSRGERRTVDLPDGTIITLNSESKLKFPESFEADFRVVYLEGHAHFDVARDPEKPFIIYSNFSKTQVLGTSFDVKAGHKEEKTEVIVKSGKVAFSERSNPENSILLAVNEKAILLPEQKISKSTVNAAVVTAWKDNLLLFRNNTFEEIIDVLEPWYDVQIEVKKPALLKQSFTLSYDDPTLSSLIERMSFVAKFNYEIVDNTVTIY